MSFTNTYETDMLELIFENVDCPNIGDATGLRGATTPGSFYVTLTTTAITDAGTITGECNYTGFARVGVTRATGSWTTASGSSSNTAAITFGEKTAGGDETVGWVGLCYASTLDVADVIMWAALDATLSVTNGTIPEFAANQLEFTLD